jgi:hypothetical protein
VECTIVFPTWLHFIIYFIKHTVLPTGIDCTAYSWVPTRNLEKSTLKYHKSETISKNMISLQLHPVFLYSSYSRSQKTHNHPCVGVRKFLPMSKIKWAVDDYNLFNHNGELAIITSSLSDRFPKAWLNPPLAILSDKLLFSSCTYLYILHVAKRNDKKKKGRRA